MLCSPLQLLLAAALGLRILFAAGQSCGALVKSIKFDGASRTGAEVPYTEELAYQDWAPYAYLDGFYDDPSTRGTNNKRAMAVEEGGSRTLEVMLPEGCVTSECAMQTKSVLVLPLDSATLKFKMKFGPNFDWVRGGKLPGLCGADCLTGCKEVTGLDGFSARQMWRPCVWPPEHEDNEINCVGGKLVAYVYHMNKVHWCGDDFEYSNDLWAREYSTAREPVVPKNFFQPQPDEWYTVWSHLQMNTAGPPGQPENFQADGTLQTWMEGPGFGPLLVVDKQDMSWRRYNNVSIDTLYFSVFFGGSSPSFRAKKDETIRFDDFQIWEGKCEPANEPFQQEVTLPRAEWEGMRTDLSKPTVLLAKMAFTKAFTGGGCARFEIENTAGELCEDFEIELNVRPAWGGILERNGDPNLSGSTLVDSDLDAGWFLIKPNMGMVEPGMVNSRAGVCVQNRQSAKYLLTQMEAHVVAYATCIAGPAATSPGTSMNPNDMEDPDVILPAPRPEVVQPPDANDSGVAIDEEQDWCKTTASDGGIWDLFSMVKSKLCSGDSAYDKPWGPVDVDAVKCPCGQVAIFPDNACVTDDTNPECPAEL